MAITVGSTVRRVRGKRAVGTVLSIWTARDWTGAPILPERRMARVAWPCARLGGGDNLIRSNIRLDALQLVEAAEAVR